MNKNLSSAERLAQWYYSLNYEQLGEDRKALINDIVADLFKAAQQRLHLTAFGVGIISFMSGFLLCLWMVYPYIGGK